LGFVLVTMLICSTVLLAFLGLAIDAGYIELVKTRMQAAADAAAIGGTQELKLNGATNVVSAAKGDAALNGFTDGSHGVTITVNSPPLSGDYAGNPMGVEAIISQRVPTFFMQLAGTSSVTVRARASARLGSSPNCLYMLDPSGSGAFSATNGVKVDFSCGIFVNSTSASAFTASGGAKVTASSINVVGGTSISNGAKVNPDPVTGVSAPGDPLAYVQAPAAGGCTYTNTVVSGGNVTLPQGVYCNGITVNNGARVTFSGGTYVLMGGGLNLGGGASVSGTGVTFYNSAGSGFSYRPINIDNGTSANLSAPTTGNLAGILFFQDRGIASGSGSIIAGGATLILNGALYFPTTTLSFSNGATTSSAYTLMVAKSVSFTGGVKVNNDYSSLRNGSPIKGSAMLSE
jgi:hypothetical protein